MAVAQPARGRAVAAGAAVVTLGLVQPSRPRPRHDHRACPERHPASASRSPERWCPDRSTCAHAQEETSNAHTRAIAAARRSSRSVVAAPEFERPAGSGRLKLASAGRGGQVIQFWPSASGQRRPFLPCPPPRPGTGGRGQAAKADPRPMRWSWYSYRPDLRGGHPTRTRRHYRPDRRSVRGYLGIFSCCWPPSAVPVMAQWTVSRAVYLYIAALEVNVLNCREECLGRVSHSADWPAVIASLS